MGFVLLAMLFVSVNLWVFVLFHCLFVCYCFFFLFFAFCFHLALFHFSIKSIKNNVVIKPNKMD